MPKTAETSDIVVDMCNGSLRIVDGLTGAGMPAFAVSVKPVEGCHIVNEQQPQASTVLHSIQDTMLSRIVPTHATSLIQSECCYQVQHQHMSKSQRKLQAEI